MSIFVCFQFEQAADSELTWLAETERKLLSMGEIRLEQDQTTAQLHAQKVSLPSSLSVCMDRHKLQFKQSTLNICDIPPNSLTAGFPDFLHGHHEAQRCCG